MDAGSTAIIIENLGKRYSVQKSIDGAEVNLEGISFREAVTYATKSILGKMVNQPKVVPFWALKDINLSVKRGDRLGILGHNGAGKSTLLKILSRVTGPTTGKITINGSIASLLEVGTGFHPELTGRENIYLNGSILGMRRDEIRRKFDEIVAFAEINEFLDTPIKRYSSGMYARLGFAVAAHLESEILIVDEVLAVGDVAFQQKCIGKMDEVSKNESKTILFVSHNIASVRQLCNKAIVLDGGQLIHSGDISSAINLYNSKIFRSNEMKIIKKAPGINLISVKAAGNVKSGDCWHLVFDFESDLSVEDCYFDFGFYNRTYSPISHVVSSKTGKLFKIDPGHFQISIQVEDLHLNSGGYLIGIYLSTYSGCVLFEALDIEAAEVIDSPIYTGGTAIISNRARIEITQANSKRVFLN